MVSHAPESYTERCNDFGFVSYRRRQRLSANLRSDVATGADHPKSLTDDLVQLGLRIKEKESKHKHVTRAPDNSSLTSTFADVELLKSRLEKEKHFGSLRRSKICADYIFPASVTNDAIITSNRTGNSDDLNDSLLPLRNGERRQSLNALANEKVYFGGYPKNFNSLNTRLPASGFKRNVQRDHISQLFASSSDKIRDESDRIVIEKETADFCACASECKSSCQGVQSGSPFMLLTGLSNDTSSCILNNIKAVIQADDSDHERKTAFANRLNYSLVSRRNLLRKHHSVSDMVDDTVQHFHNDSLASELRSFTGNGGLMVESDFSERVFSRRPSFKIPSFQEFKQMQKGKREHVSCDFIIPEEEISNLTLTDQNYCDNSSDCLSTETVGTISSTPSHSFSLSDCHNKANGNCLADCMTCKLEKGSRGNSLSDDLESLDNRWKGRSNTQTDLHNDENDNGIEDAENAETENTSNFSGQSPDMEEDEDNQFLRQPENGFCPHAAKVDDVEELDDNRIKKNSRCDEVSEDGALQGSILPDVKPSSGSEPVKNQNIEDDGEDERGNDDDEEEEETEEEEDDEDEYEKKKENKDLVEEVYNPDIWNFLDPADVGSPEVGTPNELKAFETLRCIICGEDADANRVALDSFGADIWCRKCASKNEEHRRAIQEIIDTEISYGNDLGVIKNEFYLPLKENGLLTDDQLQTIFLNLDELIMINRYLVEKLRKAVPLCHGNGNEDLTAYVVRVFLDSANMLMAFEAYCINQSGAPFLLDQLLAEKELLRVFLDEQQKENPILRKMDLKSFLIVPVQRVMKYPLLLDRLYRVTSSSCSQQQSNIVSAKRMIEETLAHINSKTIGSVKMKRRSSATPWPSKKNFSLENVELTQLALEMLGWNRYVTYFVMIGRLGCSALLSSKWAQQLNSLKYQSVHCAIATLGMAPNYKNEVISFPQNSMLRSAALVIIKERAGKYSPLREPMFLDKCVVAMDPDVPTVIEVIEMNKDSYLLKADDSKETETWYWQLRMIVKDLGLWRRRRNAMANIVTHRRESAQRAYSQPAISHPNNVS